MLKLNKDCSIPGLTGLLHVTSSSGELNLNDKHHIKALKAIVTQLSRYIQLQVSIIKPELKFTLEDGNQYTIITLNDMQLHRFIHEVLLRDNDLFMLLRLTSKQKSFLVIMHFLATILENIDKLTFNSSTWTIVVNKFNENMGNQISDFENSFANMLINLMPESIYEDDKEMPDLLLPQSNSKNITNNNYSIASDLLPKSSDDFSLPSDFSFLQDINKPDTVYSKIEVDEIKNLHLFDIQQLTTNYSELINQKNAEIEQLTISHKQQLEKMQADCLNYVNTITLKHSYEADIQQVMHQNLLASTNLKLDENSVCIGNLKDKLASVEATSIQILAEKDETIKSQQSMMEHLKEQQKLVISTSSNFDSSAQHDHDIDGAYRTRQCVDVATCTDGTGTGTARPTTAAHESAKSSLRPLYSTFKNIILNINNSDNKNMTHNSISK